MSEYSLPKWGLPAFSWVVSFYFLLSFVMNVGFPPDRRLFTADFLYVFLWLFFIFLPFFSRIKIGAFLELEREVANARKELSEFKAEVRNSMSVLSTNVNTIGGMTNQVIVNVPAASDIRAARQAVEQEAPDAADVVGAPLDDAFITPGEDPEFAVVRTRIEIERLLRKILSKGTQKELAADNQIKYMSLNKLFDQFIGQNPTYFYLRTPFRYLSQLANAAVHAQKISDEQVTEALALGAEVIAVLRKVGDRV